MAEQAYCVKEKTMREMKNGKEVMTKNGRRMLKGVCASCGAPMNKFLPMKKT
jgi:hypothetical protein